MEKINVAELLKDCPIGMELDCTKYSNVYFVGIDDCKKEPKIKLKIQTFGTWCSELTLDKYGKESSHPNAKCLIFPKGKTTWEGFVPPCKFKDGDVLYVDCTDEFDNERHEYIFILNRIYNDEVHSYCYYYMLCDDFHPRTARLTDNKYPIRFATEEEKEELFQAIKDNGYKWNPESKTLEKLEDVDDKGNISDGYHTFNELYEYRLLYNASMFNELAKQGLYDVHKSKRHSDGTIPFGDENWFIVQAELPTGQISNHYEMKDWGLFNVPEKEKANPYDGHTPQDVAKRLRDFLSLKKLPKFKVGDRIRNKKTLDKYTIYSIDEDSYCVGLKCIWICDQDEYELVSDKFDITTLKPFDKVLARDSHRQIWTADLFSHNIEESVGGYKFACIGHCWHQCIPYKDNEHLLNTTNDCKEYFKTWK